MLTDTTFWIDLIEERRARQHGPATHFLATNRAISIRVSLITWEELAEGFESSADLDAVLRRVKVAGISRQVAWETSRVQRELNAIGVRLGENDAWIAGTARAWGMRLVSRDRRFRDVPRLTVVSY